MKINRARLVKQLKEDEGVRYNIYKCPAGYDTIGAGRNIESLGLTQEEIKYLGMESLEEIYEKELTEADVEFLLANDIDRVLEEVQSNFTWFNRLDAVRKEVVLNMVFNLGLPRFKKFKKMIAALQEGDYDEAAQQMLNSLWYTQVGHRSQRLTLAMLNGQF